MERIGHRERESAASALVSHLTAGRLSPVEFEERADVVAQARTAAELRAVFVDLPPSPHWPGSAGRLPDDVRASLAAEELLVLDEDLLGSITYRRYRANGVRVRRKQVALAGAVAVTTRRLLVWAAGSKHVDVPLAHPLRLALDVQAEKDLLHIAYDAKAFRADRSGRVELRFTTTHAKTVARLLGSAPR